MSNNNQEKLILLQDLGRTYPNETSNKKTRYGIFKCFCGKEFKAITYDVKRGHTSSCGCYKIKKNKQCNTTHGLRYHRLYSTWENMIERCFNKNVPNYKYYGEKNISVCDEWKDIKNFIKDMYPSFKEGLTLDREDNNLGYSKDNCRWVNKCIQARNTKRLYSHNTSGFRGVTFVTKSNKFRAQIKINSKVIYLGYFNLAKDAALAFDNYIHKYNLEHTTNFTIQKEIK